MTQTISILIVDDHRIVRKGLRAMLQNEPDFEVIGEAADGKKAISQVCVLKPDVVLMDLVMPKRHITGLEAISQIKQENPQINILVLTSYVDDEKIIKSLRAGALGYLPKDISPETLYKGIRSVHAGEPFLAPAAMRRLIKGLRIEQEETLTNREIEVLKLVAQGFSNRRIAVKLLISERTVGAHVSGILGKLNLSNRVQLALYVYQKGLKDPDELSN